MTEGYDANGSPVSDPVPPALKPKRRRGPNKPKVQPVEVRPLWTLSTSDKLWVAGVVIGVLAFWTGVIVWIVA